MLFISTEIVFVKMMIESKLKTLTIAVGNIGSKQAAIMIYEDH